MSLHQLANHMSAQGRGPDSTLVHMSPREVSGLQSLAMANGGTLTINPETGLPEAGFLDSLLPTLLGGAATFFSGGAITPFMAALGVGGLTALTSKDLGKGLMAGLGAYGGAGITEGLAGFGAADIGEKAIGAATADATAAGLQNVPGSSDAYAAAMQKGVADRMAGATYSDRLAAGASKALSNPMGAFNSIGGGSVFNGALKVGAPLVAALASQDQTSVPTFDQIKFDPRPANINIRRDQLPYQRDTGSSGQRGYFGPTYIGNYAADGGFVSDGGIEHFGAGGRTRRDPVENMPIIRPGQNLTPADLVNLGNRGSRRFTPVKPPEFYYPSEIGKDSLPPGKPNVNPSGYANPANSAQRSSTFVEKPVVQQPIQPAPQQPIQPITQRPTEPIAPTQPTQPVEPTPQRPIEPTQPTQRPVNETGMVPKQVQPAPQQPIQPVTQQPIEPTRPVAQQPMEPPRPQQPMEPTRPTQRHVDETGMVPRQVVENPVIVPRLEGGRDSAAKGGLMALAVGGGVPLDPDYDYSGYGRKKTDVTRPVTPMPDVPKPDFLAADGKTYRYDPIKRSWYVIKEAEAKTNPGVETLMGGEGRGNNSIAPRDTTPIANNGFFSSILGRTTQDSAPVVTKDMYTPSAVAEREGRLGRYSSLSGLQARQAETDAEAALNAESQALGKQTHINLTTQYEDALQAADAANKAEQTQRDAVTSANSPTATGGKANSSGIASLGVNLDAGELSNRNPATTTISDRISALANNARASQALRAADDREARDLANAQAQAQATAAVQSDAVQAAKDNADNPTPSTGTAPDSGPSGAPPGGDPSAEGNPNGEAHGGMVGRYAQGGLGSLGGYSDGGRLLRGPGDGVSDSIPATVGDRQPARLADGEFVVPARIVSELGNGSTEAGARALYKMMDRIQANRRKTTGKNNVAVNSKSHKYLPA